MRRLRLREAQTGALLVFVDGLLALAHARFYPLQKSPLVVLEGTRIA